MTVGVVISYDGRRGLGEVEIEFRREMVSVFVAEVERAGLTTLAPGDRLRFDIKDARTLGRYAINLTLLQ